jgi:hypothetical protein
MPRWLRSSIEVINTFRSDDDRRLAVRSRPIRYLDDFIKQDGPWFFAERRLMINWIDTRPLQA